MSWSAADLSLARANVDENNTKRVSLTYTEAIGRVDAVRKFRVNSDKHDLVCRYLNDYGYAGGTAGNHKITDPEVGDDVLPGTYAVIANYDGTSSGDPNYVYQALRKIYSLTATDSMTAVMQLAALDKVLTQEERVLAPYGFASGTLWDRAVILNDIDPASKTEADAYTAANLLAALSVPAGWKYVDRQFKENGDNTATFVVLFRDSEFASVWEDDKRLVGVSGSGDDLVQTHQTTMMPDGSIHSIFAALGTDTGYVLKSKSLTQNPDTGERIILRSQQAINLYDSGDPGAPTDSDALIISIQDRLGRSTPTIQRRWYRWDEAAKNALVASAGLARQAFEFEGAEYKHLHVSIQDHHDGAYTITQYLVLALYSTLDFTFYDYAPQTRTDDTSPVARIEEIRYHIYRTYVNFRDTYQEAEQTALDEKPEFYNTIPISATAYRLRNSVHVGAFDDYSYRSTVTWYIGVSEWQDLDTHEIPIASLLSSAPTDEAPE